MIWLSSSSHIVSFLFFYGLVIIFVTTANISASYSGNETDHLALLSFKSMISQDPFGALTSWNSSFHFCDWNGVLCGKRHRRVTSVRLNSQGLKGSLSPHIGNLSFLGELWLRNNSFEGSIPHELGRLSRLRFLYLHRNKFSGVIPTNFSNLVVLSLGYNELVGSIPKEITFLPNLTFVGLNDNKLTGGIPPFLGNITSIEVFSVARNPLGGRIPDNLGRWKSLTEFYAARCNLYGTIPHSIYNLSLVANFSLPDNQLTGSLPPAIGSMFPHLAFLQLRNNQLTGFLPPSISNCSKLIFLEMSANMFSGKLTIEFSKLREIKVISLDNNNLSGPDDLKFIDSLQNCSRLEHLSLRTCKLQGALPRSIGNLSHQLGYLDLFDNQIYGNLPVSVGNLVGLNTLHLRSNRITGNIPSTIGKLQNLQALVLYENQLSGLIPEAIGNLSSLITLDLYSNLLEGVIPSSLRNCDRLTELYLGYNKLNGKISIQLLQLSSLSIWLDLSHNNLLGTIPLEVGNLNMLNNLDLSDNQLTGTIPSSLGSCTSLLWLSLKGNLFQGTIPVSLSSLKGVAELDFSQNNLSGQIPRFLEQFSLLYINLSFNDFEGELPVLGVFANASAFSVLGNNRLCGGLVELGLPKCKETKKHKRKFPTFVIVILIAFTLFIILSLVYALCKKKRNGRLSQSSRRNEQFLKVSYNQLLKATNGFSETNLIGNGEFSSVYKGILGNDDTFVAVKVIHLRNRGAYKSFLRECEAWRSTRHRNLLKIITSCSSVDFQGNDFKALVYEFMPNGSLHDWLHSNASTSRLNIFQRINILIDVASALDYLHNHCITTVVHGDLKPSNILLDNDMVAHVGDFGLARFLGAEAIENSSTGIRGTIGYAPPEYGLGSEMTSSGDVYSFGILLLEVMTGKKPTDDIFNEAFSLHTFAEVALPDLISNVIENDLLNDAISMKSKASNAKKIEGCVASTVKIGVLCSVDSPTHRMNIENVVNELKHILVMLQNI